MGGAEHQTKLTLFCAVHHVTPDELRTCPGGAEGSGDRSSRGTRAAVSRRACCEAGPSVCPHAETDGARIVHPGSPRDGMCGWCSGRHGSGPVVGTGPLSGSGANARNPLWQPIHVDDVREVLAAAYDRLSEVRARGAAELPYDPEGDGAGWGVRGGFARA